MPDQDGAENPPVSFDAPSRPSRLRVGCECRDGCSESVWIRVADYELARRRRRHYAVVEGHSRMCTSRVVVRGEGYDIVCDWQ
jgi:hypothetical protein